MQSNSPGTTPLAVLSPRRDVRRRPRQRRRQSHILGEGRADDKSTDRARHHRIRTKVFGPPSLVHRSHRPLRRRRAPPPSPPARNTARSRASSPTPLPFLWRISLSQTPFTSILACSNAVSGSNDVVFVDARYDAGPPPAAPFPRVAVSLLVVARPSPSPRALATRARIDGAHCVDVSRARSNDVRSRARRVITRGRQTSRGAGRPRPRWRFANLRGTKRRRAKRTPSWSLTRSEWTSARRHAKGVHDGGIGEDDVWKRRRALEPALGSRSSTTLGRRCPLLDVDGRGSHARHRPSVEMRMT